MFVGEAATCQSLSSDCLIQGLPISPQGTIEKEVAEKRKEEKGKKRRGWEGRGEKGKAGRAGHSSFGTHPRQLDFGVLEDARQISIAGEDVPDAQLGEEFLQVVGTLNGELGEIKFEAPGKRKEPFLD